MERTPMLRQKWFYSHVARENVKARLFCLAHAGGSGQAYNNWSAAMPDAVEVVPVMLPGRGLRIGEPVYTRMGPLVSALADSLADLLDLPFVFFGHSLGALIAFEVARTVRRLYGVEPRCLVVAGSRSPERSLIDQHCTDSDQAMIQTLRNVGGTPAEILDNSELLEWILPAIRGDFQVFRTYEYLSSEPLKCAIMALGGNMDEMVTEDDLYAWRRHTHGSFEHGLLEGGHFFVRSAESAVLERLCTLIGRYVPEISAFPEPSNGG